MSCVSKDKRTKCAAASKIQSAKGQATAQKDGLSFEMIMLNLMGTSFVCVDATVDKIDD